MALPEMQDSRPPLTLPAEPATTLRAAPFPDLRTAEERARDIAKTNQVLQATIDVLRESGDLDLVAARVLRIAAQALGSDACAVFENEPSGLVSLKYWCLHGQIFTPGQLVHLEKSEIVPKLEAGFTVPGSYLGGYPQNILGPVVLDHRSGTSVPEFDLFAVANGWDWELNIGVAANGIRAFTFCVYRGREWPFSEAETALADSLARQLGLAAETRRLAENARETALAREREKAAQERVRELAKVNETLRRGLDRFADFDRLDGYATSLIQEAAEVFGADAAAVLVREGRTSAFHPVAVVTDGHAWSMEEIAADPFLGTYSEVSAGDPGGIMSRIIEQTLVNEVILDEQLASAWPAAYEFHRQRYGHRVSRQFPLRMRGRMLGFFAFALRQPDSPTPTQLESVAALAQQFTLALEMTRLADKARETALAREREQAAQLRAAELSKANAELALRDRLLTASAHALQQLTSAADFDAGVREALRRIGEAAGVSRIKVLFERNIGSEPVHEVVYEWWDEKLSSQSSLNFTRFPTSQFAEVKAQWVAKGQWWARVEDWPDAVRPLFRQIGVLSVGVVPIFARDEYVGCVAYDECFSDRCWSKAEIDALTIAARGIGAALWQRRTAAELALQREQAAEQRAAELAKVNRSLRESVHVVAHSADFDQSLSEVVLRISAAAGAKMGALFGYEEATNTLCYEFWFENGILHWEPDLNGPPCMREPFDADVTPAFRHYSAQQQIFYVNLEEIDPIVSATAWPGTLDWHLASGHRAACAIPVSAGRTLGIIGLAWNQQVVFSAEQLEILLALSNHAALVMQLRRMERTARAATIAREQEQAAQVRAAELAQLNTELQTRSRLLEVVAQVSGLLARSPDFECALLNSLRLIGEAAQLSRVLVLLARSQPQNQSEKEHHIISEWCAPGIRTHAECGLEVISNEDARQFVERLSRGDSFWVHAHQVEHPLRNYFERLGIVGTGCAPIFLDNQYAGVVAFDDCFAPRTTETAQVDALTAAANTIAAALQSRRDTERLVSERELAAHERAAELAKANEALKQTLDVVAFEPDLNQVLGHVMASITQQLGSPSSALWLWEQDSGKFRTHLVFHEGRVLELTEQNRKALQGVWGSGRGLQWKDHIRARKPVVYQVTDLEGAQERAFFERLGIQSLLGIPLLLGSEIVGSITIRFNAARTLQVQELELAQALAHQATMAVQLTRLAERAGEAALSEERARFAREIHDTLAQGFTGILMQLGAISQVEGSQRSDIQPQLAAMTALARASLAEARRSVRAFRPASGISDLRLDRAIEQFVEKVRLQTEATVTLAVEGTSPKLSQRAAGELSGIVQEALHNAVKHARAKRICVSLYFERHPGVSISIEDDGVGFDSAAQTGSDCFGLIGMQERANSIGASLTVISEKGRGTEIILQYTAP